MIGGDSGAPCCLDAQISPAEPTVIYLKPNRPDLVWNQIEPIAWELAASKRYGFLPSYRQVLVRGYGTEAPPPLVTAKQALRILIVSGATKHHVNAPLDTAAAQAHLERACCRPIPIHIDRVEGENTLEKLQSIISHGKRWDIVHVIAHGSREGKSLCLDKGGQPWFCGYAEFASELARIEDLRLVTLNVCESSTLALEIANRAPKARIVATLYEMKQDTLQRFFGTFYRLLLDLEHNPDPSVEEAYGGAVHELFSPPCCAEWFLPVLYAPVTGKLEKLLDSSLEQRLGDILKLVRAGDFKKAEEQAQLLSTYPEAALMLAATDYLCNVTGIQNFHVNIAKFEEAVLDCARRPGPNRWKETRQSWGSRDFRAPQTAGAAAFAHARPGPLDPILPAFKEIFDGLESLKGKVLEAVGKFCEYEDGKTRELLDGCKLLLKAESVRPRLQGAAKTGFVQGLRSTLARANSGLDQAQKLASGNKLAKEVYENLAIVSEARTLAAEAMADRAGSGLLSPQEAVEIEASAREVSQCAWDLLSQPWESLCSAAQSKNTASGFDAEWLQPGRRLDLCLWWLKPAAPVAAAPAKASAGVPEFSRLMEIAKQLSEAQPVVQREGPLLDPASFPASRVPLLINEGAPFLLACELPQPLDPYLCLAALEAGPNSSAQEIRDKVSFAAAGHPDPERNKLLTQASMELGDLKRRLCLDAYRFPVDAVDVCSERFKEMAEHSLSGQAAPAFSRAGLSQLDQAGLLAVAGRIPEASDLTATLAFENPADAELVRAAYLAAVQLAEVTLDDMKRFAVAVRRAMAFLGILIGNPALISGWIGRRYAVYQQAVPEERSAHQELVANELLAMLRRVLDKAEAKGNQGAVRGLRLELNAELEGGREKGMSPLFAMRGGYHAARLSGTLAKDGQQLAGVYRTLAGLAPAAYMTFVAATGMSTEFFHRLVFLLSEFRLAVIEPSEIGRRLLEPLLPEDFSFDTEPPEGVYELLASDSFAERYPCHAAIELSKQATVLSAHAAMVDAASKIEELKRELAGTQRLARIKNLLGKVSSAKAFVASLGYKVVGASPDLMAQVEGLCVAWVSRILEQESPNTPEGKAQCRDLLAGAATLADNLSSESYGLTRGAFNQARAKLHLALSVLLSNELNDVEGSMKHVRIAYRCDPESGMIVCNYARACVNDAAFLAAHGRKDEGRSILDQAIEDVALFIQRHEETDVADLEAELRSLTRARRDFDAPSGTVAAQRLEPE